MIYSLLCQVNILLANTLDIFHELDTYKTGTVTPKSFKAGIYELASRQLLVKNAVERMLSIDQSMTTKLTEFRTEVEGLKKEVGVAMVLFC